MRGHFRLGLFLIASCFVAATATAQPYPQDQLLETQLVPDIRAGYDDLFFNRGVGLDDIFEEAVQGAWMRLEYLNYRISSPQEVTLGAPLADVQDPSRPFDVTDTAGILVTQAKVPILQGVQLDNLNGIRGSVGLPVGNVGWIEGSAWGLSEATAFASTDRLPFIGGLLATGPAGTPPVTLLATTLLGNGGPGNRFLIYDQDFSARYQSDIWSGEANLVFNVDTPQQGLRVQSLLGFRRIQLDEQLEFGGTYTNVSDIDFLAGPVALPRRSSIASKAHNNMYGGQLGLRAEYVTNRFTLGVEPKVVLMHNRTTANVTTQNLRTAFIDGRTPDPLIFPPVQRLFTLDDPTRTTLSSDIQFSPGLDVGVYAKLNVTSWFNLKFGYNLLWLGNLSSPENNIVYNDDGDQNNNLPNTPGVVVRQSSFTDRFIDGISIGGEILLP